MAKLKRVKLYGPCWPDKMIPENSVALKPPPGVSFGPGRVVRMDSISPCPPALTYSVGMPVLGTLCSESLHWEYLVINAAELFNTYF